MAKEPFVSGVYRPEEDAQNRPLPSIKRIVNDAITKKKVRKFYSSQRTPEYEDAERRRYPDD